MSQSSTPQLNPPMYLVRVIEAIALSQKTIKKEVEEEEEREQIKLRWYIQALSTLSSKSSIGPFVASKHVFTVSINEILRIPPTYEPILYTPPKKSSNNRTDNDILPALDKVNGDAYTLPKGWGIKRLENGLDKDEKGKLPNQLPHEMFTGLTDHYKTRGGKSLFDEKETFVGVEEEDGGKWRSFVKMPKKGFPTVELGIYHDKLAALVAHDQAARHYYAELHKDDEDDESEDLKYITNFSSDADAKRWWNKKKAGKKGKGVTIPYPLHLRKR
jgi:hypothetical protein